MIRLTGESGRTVLVAPELIACITVTSQGNTGINYPNGYVIVTESPRRSSPKGIGV